MGKLLLPPDFVKTPVGPLFDPKLPDGVFRTWLQLRAFAWNAAETPEISFDQLVEKTGKKRSALYKHMRMLDTLGLLSWRSASHSTLIVSFNANVSNGELDGLSESLGESSVPGPASSGRDGVARVVTLPPSRISDSPACEPDSQGVKVISQSTDVDFQSTDVDSQSTDVDKPLSLINCVNNIDIKEVSQSTDVDSQSRNLDARSQAEKPKRKARTESCPGEWMDRLYHLCRVDKGQASPGMRKRISNAGKTLIERGRTLDDLAEFERRWYENDWRGRKGSPPTPEQVLDLWVGIMAPPVEIGGNNGKSGHGSAQERPQPHRGAGTDGAGANQALATLKRRARAGAETDV